MIKHKEVRQKHKLEEIKVPQERQRLCNYGAPRFQE